MKKQTDIKKEQIKGMSIYCDKCKKHTGVYAIASEIFTIVKMHTNCCNNLVK